MTPQHMFQTVVDLAISAMEDHSAQAEDARQSERLGVPGFVWEFRRLRLAIGSRIGHTSQIIRLAQPGDLVVCNSTVRQMVLTGIENARGRNGFPLVVTPEQFQQYARVKTWNTIWVDNGSAAGFADTHDNIWPLLRSRDQRVIILG